MGYYSSMQLVVSEDFMLLHESSVEKVQILISFLKQVFRP